MADVGQFVLRAALRSVCHRPIGRGVRNARHLILRHRLVAMAIIVLALALRALIPAGMMIAPSSAVLTLTVTICSGMGAVEQVSIPIERDAPTSHQDGKGAGGPCAFAGLGAPALGGADVALIGLALLLVFAAAFLPIVPVSLRRQVFAWPHLRGPPLTP